MKQRETSKNRKHFMHKQEFKQAIMSILESHAGDPISFPKGVWSVQFEKVAEHIAKLHIDETRNVLAEAKAKARTNYTNDYMMLGKLSVELTRRPRKQKTLGSKLSQTSREMESPCPAFKEERCNHEGDKNNFHPQFCKKCGKEFIYVPPYFI